MQSKETVNHTAVAVGVQPGQVLAGTRAGVDGTATANEALSRQKFAYQHDEKLLRQVPFEKSAEVKLLVSSRLGSWPSPYS